MALILLLLACRDPDPQPTRPEPYSADWAGVEALLDARCVVCHTVGADADVLPFPQAIAVDLADGGGDLVVAGDPGASVLWRVLIGELGPDDFAVMPLWSGPLSDSEIEHVGAWIADGAAHPFGGEDFDGDGFTADGGDCDESSADAFPGAHERCDGDDDDCDGLVDEADAVDASSWWPDGDGDGHGDPSGAPAVACDAPPGHAATADDCDDAAAAVFPGAEEVPNGVDEDCDGFTDELTSHERDVRPLYAYNCGCHTSGLEPILVLGDDAYDALVGQPAVELPTMSLVEPGDPEASYLWHKLNGTHLSVGGSGDAMPRLAPPLPGPDLARIEAWILESAPP